MHQNQGGSGEIVSLCLYFEPSVSVNRTWTPENFLRRIQWWMEMSSKGELHPASQPVEHLFFASKYELILPWNLPALRAEASQGFLIERTEDRTDGGFTCSLLPRANLSDRGDLTLVELILSPVVHGFVELDPLNLGQLVDLFGRRHVDLLNELKEVLRARVATGQGSSEASDHKGTVILVRTPICRAEGEPPTRVAHRAFLVPKGGYALGEALGVLMLHEHKYYDSIGTTIGVDVESARFSAWRELPVFALDVLKRNDGAAARAQSGISSAGPDGVLIGAGSLGSALINMWGRAGWGHWTVIDKDHVKPHNLSRHTAFDAQIGLPKATAVAHLHQCAVGGASEVRAICADATDFANGEVRSVLEGASLIIDVSTTLEYPRAASGMAEFARHVSAFITPGGNAAVLLVEDASRSLRLRTLESQYYRAVIQQDWGEGHLGGDFGSFWSGASCRDISMVMPYSSILGAASTLAEQIPRAVVEDGAVIRIWQRDRMSGAVSAHDVPAAQESSTVLGDLELFIDEGVEAQLRLLREQAFPNETGGVLLGYYDFNQGVVVVVAGLPAPPDSKATPSSFSRGVEGLLASVSEASRRTGGVVGYIGEWHSHPPGHSAAPSRDDMLQLAHLALGMDSDGLPAVQLIVGEDDVRITQGVAR